MSNHSYREAIKLGLEELMTSEQKAVVIGQGVGDPTAIFGSTEGFADKFGTKRIIDTPIMEEGIMGVCVGLALAGIYPIQTHIRMDFLLLAMNQLVNSVAKYRYMYDGQFEIPMLIRVIVGRSWGQGPQHSQSLQALLAHVPGLTVVMPSTASDVYSIYSSAGREFNFPIVSIEHRFLYDYSFKGELQDVDRPIEELLKPRLVKSGKDITVVATSYMVQEALRANSYFESINGPELEIIDLRCVSSIDTTLIFESLSKTRRLIIADSGWAPYGVSAEICRLILMSGSDRFTNLKVRSLGMAFVPCPTSHALEEAYYDDMSDICKAVIDVCDFNVFPNVLPTKSSAKKMRLQFRGPF